MKEVKMVDLLGQYLNIKKEIDDAIQQVILTTDFINGKIVREFKEELQKFLNVKHVIPCANGTDALQIALMALNLEKGDEVIVPTFSFGAPAETVAFLGYIPVFAEVDANTFNISIQELEKLITPRTRAIIPVHLFGQCAPLEDLLKFARKHNLYIIEDNAQSLGAEYTFSDGTTRFAGTIGDIGITSFFPSKNLSCMGDGGAIFTNDDKLAEKAQIIANHGQRVKYKHEIIGVNSRLDGIQAAILKVKLKYLKVYNSKRQEAAKFYNDYFNGNELIQAPFKAQYSTHVFHQYTITIMEGGATSIKEYLDKKMIPSMIYYPSCLHLQEAFRYLSYQSGDFPVAESLTNKVISLPMHTELTEDQLSFICENLLVGLGNLNVKEL